MHIIFSKICWITIFGSFPRLYETSIILSHHIGIWKITLITSTLPGRICIEHNASNFFSGCWTVHTSHLSGIVQPSYDINLWLTQPQILQGEHWGGGAWGQPLQEFKFFIKYRTKPEKCVTALPCLLFNLPPDAKGSDEAYCICSEK